MRNGSRVLVPAAWVVGVGLIVAFPFIAPNAYILSAGIVILNYALTATSWNFLGGLIGYMSLGHAAYFGLGAYATGLLITRAGVSSFVALIIAGVLIAALAIPIGFAALRLRGASFVIVSISLVLILALVFQAWGSFTGGSNGLTVPRPFPDLMRPDHHRVFFYLFAGLLAIALALWFVIDRSRFGTRLKAIREDEDKAESLGVPTYVYKLIAFVISATMTALAGGMYALWFGDLDPIFQFSILMGASMVLMALLGGVRHLLGPLLGAVVVGIALEYFQTQFGDTQFHLIATALLLGAVVMFVPEGVIPALQSLWRRRSPAATSIREISAGDLADSVQTAPPSVSRGTASGTEAGAPGAPQPNERKT